MMIMHNQAISSRHISFDYLRTIGMLFVMFPHLGTHLLPDAKLVLLANNYVFSPLAISQSGGFLGTSIFLLITGFFINSKETVGSFLKKRIVSVFVVYWLELILFCGIQIIVNQFYDTWWKQFSFGDWIKSLLFINYIQGNTELINGPAWYIFLLAILFIAETIIRILRLNRGMIPFYYSGIAFFLSLFIHHFTNISGHLLLHARYIPYLGIIVLGSVIRSIYDYKERFLNHIFQAILVLISIIVSTAIILPNNYIEQDLVSLFYAVTIFLFFTNLEKYMHSCKFIEISSMVSYSFYIVHSLYGGMSITLMLAFFRSKSLIFLLAVIISYAVACFNFLIIEKPIKLWIRKRVKNHESNNQ